MMEAMITQIEEQQNIMAEMLQEIQEDVYKRQVYCITLLYFISKGKYPIFDQFADKALDVISNNKEEFPNTDHKMYEPLPSELPTKGEKPREFKERYHEYCEKIEKLKNQLPEVYRNPRNRGLDRALWVYGHITVSYTHLDVYKRQASYCIPGDIVKGIPRWNELRLSI